MVGSYIQTRHGRRHWHGEKAMTILQSFRQLYMFMAKYSQVWRNRIEATYKPDLVDALFPTSHSRCPTEISFPRSHRSFLAYPVLRHPTQATIIDHRTVWRLGNLTIPAA